MVGPAAPGDRSRDHRAVAPLGHRVPVPLDRQGGRSKQPRAVGRWGTGRSCPRATGGRPKQLRAVGPGSLDGRPPPAPGGRFPDHGAVGLRSPERPPPGSPGARAAGSPGTRPRSTGRPVSGAPGGRPRITGRSAPAAPGGRSRATGWWAPGSPGHWAVDPCNTGRSCCRTTGSARATGRSAPQHRAVGPAGSRGGPSVAEVDPKVSGGRRGLRWSGAEPEPTRRSP